MVLRAARQAEAQTLVLKQREVVVTLVKVELKLHFVFLTADFVDLEQH